jgi:hypothetical protein
MPGTVAGTGCKTRQASGYSGPWLSHGSLLPHGSLTCTHQSVYVRANTTIMMNANGNDKQMSAQRVLPANPRTFFQFS